VFSSSKLRLQQAPQFLSRDLLSGEVESKSLWQLPAVTPITTYDMYYYS
jgi:hypothetical protein